MCVINHEINLKNLNENEIITNNILLINGIVIKPCNHLEIILYEKNSNTQVKSSISLKTGEFKILFQLISGKNNFKLIYCNQFKEIQCNFIESKNKYKIQPLYIICKTEKIDNNKIEESKVKIDLALKLVQCLYAEKLLNITKNKNNFNNKIRRTFTINSNCITFFSNLDVSEARNLNEYELWHKFASELLKSDLCKNSKLKFVAFIGCTLYEGSKIQNNDYSYENLKKYTKANATLGIGGLALFGTACLYTWPIKFNDIIPYFQNEEKIQLNKYLDDSNYRRTYGGCYATSIGSICHEIGHIFDLGHNENGIMGNDFDYINHVFTIYYNMNKKNNNIKLTEILPQRIIKDKTLLNYNNSNFQDKRLTKIKNSSDATNKFLQKYHEQKQGNDLIYFELNCLLILKFHKWLNNYSENDNENDCTHIILDRETFTVISNKSFLRVIEIRTKLNALVIKYYDLTQQNYLSFSLANGKKDNIDMDKFNIFAITEDGTVKLFE